MLAGDAGAFNVADWALGKSKATAAAAAREAGVLTPANVASGTEARE